MMQPIVMARMLGACGGAARNMGFIARTLIAWPRSTIGGRPYQDPPADMSNSNKLQARFKELLAMGLKTEGPEMALVPIRLRLSVEAKKVWKEFHDSIETQLSCSGEFGDIPDIGSKIAENAARLAGQFHVVMYATKGEDGGARIEGEISEETIMGAIVVVTWHLNEALRVIGATRKPEDVANAEVLMDWLMKQGSEIDPRTILRLGPPRLRDKKRRDAALEILTDGHWVFASENPTRLTVNPKARAEYERNRQMAQHSSSE